MKSSFSYEIFVFDRIFTLDKIFDKIFIIDRIFTLNWILEFIEYLPLCLSYHYSP